MRYDINKPVFQLGFMSGYELSKQKMTRQVHQNRCILAVLRYLERKSMRYALRKAVCSCSYAHLWCVGNGSPISCRLSGRGGWVAHLRRAEDLECPRDASSKRFGVSRQRHRQALRSSNDKQLARSVCWWFNGQVKLGLFHLGHIANKAPPT